MKVTGNNIKFLNKLPYSKDISVEHRGAEAELKSTSRGIALILNNSKIVRNGDIFLILQKDKEIFDFEKEV